MEKGSILMVPIGFCSLVAITVFLERIIGLAQKRVNPEDFSRKLLKLLNDDQFEQAETVCLQSSAAVSQIAFVALKHRGRDRKMIKDATDERGALEVARLERGVGLVGTMATIAPLLGLLGTVTGMIQVFQKIEGVQDPQIDLLAGGIWEALISTGAGLTVAIPCYVAYRYLLSRVDTAAHQMEETLIDVIDAIDRDESKGSESV
jgi:biopolymer transport protein ExbB